MSSDTVISVENLSKRYLVGHQGPQERYNSLRDTLARHGRNFARKTLDMARGRQIVQGDEVEEFWALKDVSFEVKRGEVLGIIGRNGAGKSTLLKILSRITEPTEGRIVLDGRVASLLEVGTGFHPELTGRENIFLNGAILGMSKVEIKRKFDEIVDFAGVERFLDTPVKRYSSGMYVRLAFAVAAHLESEILIIDEVLAVGDAEFQRKCLGKMQSVASGGKTVLFVSHNLGQVRSLCTQAIILNSGKIEYTGNPELALKQYQEAPASQSARRLGGPLADAIDHVDIEYIGSATGTNLFSLDEEITLLTRIRLNRPMEGLRVTFAIFANNVRLANVDEGGGNLYLPTDRGELVVRVRLPVSSLVPGRFTVGLGLCEKSPSCWAWNPEISEFELLEDPLHRGNSEDKGMVRLPWTIERDGRSPAGAEARRELRATHDLSH